jgi:hypothetical protein
MFKKIIPCLFAFALASASAQSQPPVTTANNITNNTVVTSPNAAAFTQYLKVPVGQFTGTPIVQVPLYQIKVDHMTIPVSLSYNARGVQPNVHSGWVGTNWSLIADGVISRKINNLPDEAKYNSANLGIYTSPSNDDSFGWYYSENHSRLQDPNSISLTNIENYAGNQYGNLITDTAPDEFDFSINGLTGAFFLGQDGVWKVRSANGENIQVQATLDQVEIHPFPNASSQSTLNTQYGIVALKQFVLTTGDGTKYYFGGSGQSIDFTRTASWESTYNCNIVAMAWHITEIDLPSGKKVTYQYFRDGNQYVYSPFGNCQVINSSYTTGYNFWVSFSGSSAQTVPDQYDFTLNIMDPVYLQSITFPDGKLIFRASPSNEVDNLDASVTANSIRNASNSTVPNSVTGVIGSYKIFQSYFDISYNNNYPGNTCYTSLGNPVSKWFELDDVELDDYNGTKIKNFHLSYRKDPKSRQYLSSVQETGFYNNNGSGYSLPPYTFSYNTQPFIAGGPVLPAYCSPNVDHWGFYNGNKSFPNDGSYFSLQFQTDYYNFREPDPSYVTVGSLTQMNYPTGGNTQFVYEPNDYIKMVGGGLPITVSTLSTKATGAGIRVRQIINTDNVTNNNITYQYDYVNDLTNNVSTGVLGMIRPQYFDIANSYTGNIWGGAVTISAGHSQWNSNNVFPSQNDDGNIVTYTRVIERQFGNGTYNGMKLSTYTNHDNGYGNMNPDVFVWSDNWGMDLYHYSDRAFERGLLRSEISYDQNNNLVKRVDNIYNNDTTRFDNSYVRGIFSNARVQYVTINTGSNLIPYAVVFDKNSAIRFYTYYPYLKQSTVTDYSSDHLGNTAAKTTNYYYDAASTTTSSGGYVRLTNGTTSNYSTTFSVSNLGTTTVQLGFTGSGGTNAQVLVHYSITGASSATGVLCVATGTATCSYNSSLSLANLLQGTYTITAYIQSQTNLASDVSLTISSPASTIFPRTKNLVKVVTTDSRGQSVITNYKYPLDYNLSGITPTDAFSLGVSNLQQKSAISQPVEYTTQISNSDGSNLRTTSGILNSFDPQLPYPVLTYRSSLATPKTAFTSSSISSSGTLVDDASYEPRISIDKFDAVGNPLQQHVYQGPNRAYQWAYNNNYLEADVQNVGNTQQATTTTTTTTSNASIILPTGNTNQYSTSFTISATGNTTLSIGYTGNPGTNSNAQVTLILTGPNGYSSGTIPLCLSSGTYTCSQGSSSTLSNLAAGNYTLTAQFYQLPVSLANVSVTATYPITTTTITYTGTKEFFFNSFEDPTGIIAQSPMAAHTGRNYSTATTVSWTPPVGRTYVISYWYYLSGVWKYSGELAYTGTSYNLNTGVAASATAFDDVRIYPKDGLMTTYTYDPLVGVTSTTDPKGQTVYYEYDPFLRLMNVKDKDGNIIKHTDYHYHGQ